jgi:hypothetical protein
MNLIPDFLIFIWSALGLGLLSASMERHARQIFGVKPAEETRRLRIVAGWVVLTLALFPAIYAYGLSVGVAVWVGFLAVAATLVAFMLTYRPHALHPAFYLALIGSLAAIPLVSRILGGA